MTTKNYTEKHHVLQNRKYLWHGKYYYSQVVLQLFSFDDPDLRYTKKDIMLLNSKNLNMANGEFFDLGFPKPKGEFLAAGHCYPAEKVARKSFVRITLGEKQKTLVVYGNRYWQGSGIVSVKTEPEEFSKIPISNLQAFGGAAYYANEQGKGFAYVEPEKKESGVPILPKIPVEFPEFPEDEKPVNDQSAPKMFSYPLPNTENPNSLILKKNDMPSPASFYPITYDNRDRTKLFGSYDEKWTKTNFPNFADDMQWQYFMCGAPDQQYESYFRGDEYFSIENMHPEKKNIKGQLPLWNIRCFVEKADANEKLHYSELPMQLDTVWFLPDSLQGILVWHGYTEVADKEASNLRTVQIADEGLMSERKDKAYYYELLQQKKLRPSLQERKDDHQKKMAPHLKKAQNDAWDEFEKKFHEGVAPLKDVKQHFSKAMTDFKKMGGDVSSLPTGIVFNPTKYKGKSLDEVKDELQKSKQAMGVDFFKKGEPFKQGLARLREYSDNKVKATLDPFKAVLEKHNLKVDAVIKNARNENSQAEAKSLASSMQQAIDNTDDPKFKQLLKDITKRHKNAASPDIQSKLKKVAGLILKTREQVELALKNKQSFEKCYLQCLDLRNLDFSGQNLKNAKLLHCELHNADFSNADLTNGALIGSNLSGAKFQNAILLAANLAETVMEKTNFANADLEHAKLFKSVASHADFSHTNFKNTQLTDVDWQNINLQGAVGNNSLIHNSTMKNINMRDTSFKKAMFSGGDWSDVDLSGGDFSRATFSELHFIDFPAENTTLDSTMFNECTLQQANFSKAKGKALAFIKCELKNCLFVGAKMPKLHLAFSTAENVKLVDCDLENSRLTKQCVIKKLSAERCNLNNSGWLTAQLIGALFKRCQMLTCCFNEANLSQSEFLYCDLTETRLAKVDLGKAKFYRCNLTSAMLRESNIMFTVFSHCNLYGTDFYHAVTRDTVMQKNLMSDPLPPNFEDMFIHG